jgi:hypothetical protein
MLLSLNHGNAGKGIQDSAEMEGLTSPSECSNADARKTGSCSVRCRWNDPDRQRDGVKEKEGRGP